MTDEEKMEIEITRVQSLLQVAIEGVEESGGDIRMFNAAFLVTAIRLHSEVEGPETIARALSRVGVKELKSRGAGSC